MNAFPRTLRSLAAAEARPRRALLVGALFVVAAWLSWFFLANITVVESSSAARLEVDAAPHAVQSPVAGRVLKVSLELDREVEAGEVLVELDAELERLKLEEERQRLTSLTAQLDRARGEVDAGDAASRAELRTAAAAIDEAQARARGAEATAGLSRAQQEAFDKLAAKSGVAELDRKRAEAERIAREEAASSAASGAERLAAESRAKLEDARARREKVLREIAGLEGEIGVSQTAIARLEAEIERRKLKAPIAGRLGQVAALRPGATVAEGERVALVVPKGELRVVSQFPVATAVGRVRAGGSAVDGTDSQVDNAGMGRPTLASIVVATPDRLLAAAEHEFAEHGLERARLEDIAKAAGITRASLLYHYGSKERLHAAVVEQALGSLAAILASAMSSPGTFAERLAGLVEAFLTFVEVHPPLARIVVREIVAGNAAVVELAKPVLDDVVAFIEREQPRTAIAGQARAALMLIVADAFLRVASQSLEPALWGTRAHQRALARRLLLGGEEKT